MALDGDPERSRAIKREHVTTYLLAPHQRNNLLRLGLDETDFAVGGSGRLLDAIVVSGDAEAVAGRMREHAQTGADHVCLQVLTTTPGELPLPQWRELAALTQE